MLGSRVVLYWTVLPSCAYACAAALARCAGEACRPLCALSGAAPYCCGGVGVLPDCC